MKDYVDARREFWERVAVATLQGVSSMETSYAADREVALVQADKFLLEWDKRYKQGPNGTCVPRDTEAGTYKASEAGRIASPEAI